jgi:type II restriction enzyme
MHNSTQIPKPGYCRVYEEKEGGLFGTERKKKFELYFDGGGERKLQIKALDKSLCTIHAEWIFAPVQKSK